MEISSSPLEVYPAISGVTDVETRVMLKINAHWYLLNSNNKNEDLENSCIVDSFDFNVCIVNPFLFHKLNDRPSK